SIASRMVKNFVDMVDEMAHGRKVRMDGVIMGGPPVDNVALDQEGERTLYRLAVVCAVIGVAIAYFCLHSLRLTMFVFWIAALSAGVALAVVSLTGGTCDSILLSMPALVYVLGMSGAVHLINYYHDAIREHGLKGAAERAVQHAFTPCFFAQLTTAIGLGSLFVGRLVPITKFGFYSAIGVLLTLLLLFLYLPALLYFFPSKKFAAQHGRKGLDVNKGRIHSFWDVVGKFIIKRHRIVLVVCFSMMIFFGFYLPKIKTSVKMMSFFSPDADIIKNYTWLEEKLGPLVPMELVVCFDNGKLYQNSFRTSERLELINKISEKLKSELSEDVGGTLSVALFAPDASELTSKGGAAYRTVATVVGKTVDDNRDALRDYLTVEGNPSLDELHAYLAGRARALREDFERRVADFDAELAADENVGSQGLDYAAFVDDAESKYAQDEFLAPYYAKFQALDSLSTETEKAERAESLLREEKEYFQDQNVVDLRSLLDAVKLERSFRKLVPDDVALLRESAENWLREQGVEIWRISIRVWSLKKDIDYSAFIENVKGVVEPMLAEASISLSTSIETSGLSDDVAEEIALESNAVQTRLEKAREYVEANLSDETDEKTLMWEYTVQDLSDEEREALQNSMGPSHAEDRVYPAGFSAKYTGMVPLVYKTQHELINGLTSSLIMAFFLIMIVFVFLLRSVPAGFIAMIPNVFPVVIVFGFMSWMGILVDVGTMMTASVALGVADDDTMHYLTWFSDGIGRGMTPKEAALNAYKRCATAMTQSTLIAGLGLFSFAFSTFVPTQRFGILMLSILATAVFGDLIFLPALLTCTPFGKFFVKRRFGLKTKKEDNSKLRTETE
ncbi:MAG: MMPL family transporter, partial [Thermoguttaceae bacterium]|nr:MMPL family transporter [Thermoguttaceae bacterium]